MRRHSLQDGARIAVLEERVRELQAELQAELQSSLRDRAQIAVLEERVRGLQVVRESVEGRLTLLSASHTER